MLVFATDAKDHLVHDYRCLVTTLFPKIGRSFRDHPRVRLKVVALDSSEGSTKIIDVGKTSNHIGAIDAPVIVVDGCDVTSSSRQRFKVFDLAPILGVDAEGAGFSFVTTGIPSKDIDQAIACNAAMVRDFMVSIQSDIFTPLLIFWVKNNYVGNKGLIFVSSANHVELSIDSNRGVLSSFFGHALDTRELLSGRKKHSCFISEIHTIEARIIPLADPFVSVFI
mmetsp:Transcript_7194/g.10530  ORF Transcript_7194/g.10530 Transcript_7194/m.10530 type:complete len:224 (-) Transcript_7194:240-911(-)